LAIFAHAHSGTPSGGESFGRESAKGHRLPHAITRTAFGGASGANPPAKLIGAVPPRLPDLERRDGAAIRQDPQPPLAHAQEGARRLGVDQQGRGRGGRRQGKGVSHAAPGLPAARSGPSARPPRRTSADGRRGCRGDAPRRPLGESRPRAAESCGPARSRGQRWFPCPQSRGLAAIVLSGIAHGADLLSWRQDGADLVPNFAQLFDRGSRWLKFPAITAAINRSTSSGV